MRVGGDMGVRGTMEVGGPWKLGGHGSWGAMEVGGHGVTTVSKFNQTKILMTYEFHILTCSTPL